MKQIICRRTGAPADVLELCSEPTPAVGPLDVRVEILATPIHVADLLQISGQYGVPTTLPLTPGSEGVGRVVERGARVEGLPLGQRVLVPAGAGAWRDQLVAPAHAFTPLPDGVDVEQAAMMTVNPATAALLLSSFVDMRPGDMLIQSAANSAVGTYVNQLARHRKLKVLNVVRRPAAAETVRAAGGELVVLDGPDLIDRIAQATEGHRVPLALDAVGGTTFSRLSEAVDQGGTVVSYGVMSGEAPVMSPAALVFRDVRPRGFWLSGWFRESTPDAREMLFGELAGLMARGALRSPVAARYRLDQIQQAVTHAAERSRDGKILLCPTSEA